MTHTFCQSSGPGVRWLQAIGAFGSCSLHGTEAISARVVHRRRFTIGFFCFNPASLHGFSSFVDLYSESNAMTENRLRMVCQSRRYY